MKIVDKTLLMLLLFVIAGCTSQVEVDNLSGIINNQEEVYVNVPDTTSNVCESTAKMVASAFAGAPASRGMDGNIEKVLPISDKNGNIVAYAVNYMDNGGFVVVSSSKKYMPILAYSVEGCFAADGYENTGIVDWIESVSLDQANIDSIPQDIKSTWASLWTAYTSKEQLLPQSRVASEAQTLIRIATSKWRSQGFRVYSLKDYRKTSEFSSMSYGDQCAIEEAACRATDAYGDRDEVCFMLIGDENSTTFYGNEMTTKWSQEDGYNKFTPYQSPLGCVVIAMGQIMKYHKWPSTYNWSDMPDNKATDTTASFLYNLGIALGIDYQNCETGATIDDAYRVFKEYGYGAVVKADYNTNVIRSEVSSNRPVYVRATTDDGQAGHAWVCDGFNDLTTSTGKKLMVLPPGTIDLQKAENSFVKEWESVTTYVIPSYLHMNWGWGGKYDGYYRGSSWSVNGVTLNGSPKIIYKIYPTN